jgi:hypothetical protein
MLPHPLRHHAYGGEMRNIPCCCKTGPGPGLRIDTGTDTFISKLIN